MFFFITVMDPITAMGVAHTVGPGLPFATLRYIFTYIKARVKMD